MNLKKRISMKKQIQKTGIVSMMLIGLLFAGCGQKRCHDTTAENDTASVVATTMTEAPDTIAFFFGHQLIMNDSILQQIEKITLDDPFLSIEGTVLKTGDVGWGINIHPGNIVLFSSVQPVDDKMKPVVKYLNGIYGKPYEDEEDGYDIKWSSSTDPTDVFAPGSTLVHLRRVRSEEGGSFLMFR